MGLFRRRPVEPTWHPTEYERIAGRVKAMRAEEDGDLPGGTRGCPWCSKPLKLNHERWPTWTPTSREHMEKCYRKNWGAA